MYVEFVVAVLGIRYLRKANKKHSFAPQWDKLLQGIILASVGLLMLSLFLPKTEALSAMVTDILLAYIVYLIFTRKELHPVKSAVYAVIPFICVSFIIEVIRLVSNSFYEKWNDYMDAAEIFAVLWLFGVWILTRKQRKSLEEERLRAQETEKEFRITQTLKEQLEVQVSERTAALTRQKEELEQALNELKSTQAQLIQSEKMASLGELTAGIAHEIQNPLNFVNNFSEVNTELIAEMKDALDKGDLEEVRAIAEDITANEQKINHHGKRADAIVKGMLQHSRSSTGQKEATDINALADEYLRLAYHGLRAKDKSFNASMKTAFDPEIGKINVIPQDIGRVILNLITNAFYAVSDKKKNLSKTIAAGQASTYDPTVTVSTRKAGKKVFITVEDNGSGIPAEVLDKIFQPFFTTKPTGEGTGLGLSMSYDIVTKGHGGELSVETRENEGSKFTIQLPI